MATAKRTDKPVRRSISLPPEIHRKVEDLARRERRKTNQVLEELIESGLESKESEKKRFFDLAERLSTTHDRDEQQRLKAELARMTFGE
jgi:predicted DNA-binding protein